MEACQVKTWGQCRWGIRYHSDYLGEKVFQTTECGWPHVWEDSHRRRLTSIKAPVVYKSVAASFVPLAYEKPQLAPGPWFVMVLPFSLNVSITEIVTKRFFTTCRYIDSSYNTFIYISKRNCIIIFACIVSIFI